MPLEPTGQVGILHIAVQDKYLLGVRRGCVTRVVFAKQLLALVLELPQTVLITDAQVVWVDGQRCGLSFARVSPLERSRLRRFLWKHLPDAAMSDLLPLFAVVDEIGRAHV